MTTGGVKDRVDKLIRTHKVVIFSKHGCPMCLGARNIIRKYVGNILKPSDVAFYDIEEEEGTRETLNYLKLITGVKTIPTVYIHGKFFGGLEKLRFFHRTRELEEILRKGPEVKKKL